MTLIEFLNARLTEDEEAARDGLCIHCGIKVVPYYGGSPVIGRVLAGYQHWGGWIDGEWKGWQGIRCPGRLTGAERLQRPERVLAEVEAKRWLLKRHSQRRATCWDRPGHVGWECAQCTNEYPCPTLAILTLPYATHPDYRKEWSRER